MAEQEPKSVDVEARRILVVLPNWVGDVVLATPALRALRDRFRDAWITLLGRSHLADIVAGGDWMNEFLAWPRGKTKLIRREGFLGLANRLRNNKYDLAVLLANSFRSALLARLAGAKRRVGYDRDGRGLLLTDRLLAPRLNGRFLPVPMIKYYNGLVAYLGCPTPSKRPELYTEPSDEVAAEGLIHRAGGSGPVVVIHPGASFGSAKCWLSERFAAVADRLIARFDARVFLSCGPGDRNMARAVRAAMQRDAIVLDEPVLPLRQLKALIRRSDLLITNDTGPRHFACAFDVPVVTIFGSTDPRWTETEYARERKVMVPVECGPCMKRTCPVDHRCMTRVTVDMVDQAASALLRERVGGPAGG